MIVIDIDMQLVDLDQIVVGEEGGTDNESEVFISATQQLNRRGTPSEHERLTQARRRKQALLAKRDQLMGELHRTELETKTMLRQGYFRKLKLQKKQEVFRTKQ